MDARKSKKRTLRTLDEGIITSREEWAEIFKEITGVSDRRSAIIMSSHVEAALSTIIESHLIDVSDSALKPLYDRDGALSTFFAKIHLGYAMGLFDEITRDDLEVVRRVRNAFAHVRRPINFRTIEIVKECRKFKALDDHTHEIYKRFDWSIVSNQEFAKLNARDRFVVTGLAVHWYLTEWTTNRLKRELEIIKVIVARHLAAKPKRHQPVPRTRTSPDRR
jgi:DNA-binding MltR family transcriptional regulator